MINSESQFISNSFTSEDDSRIQCCINRYWLKYNIYNRTELLRASYIIFVSTYWRQCTLAEEGQPTFIFSDLGRVA